MLKKISFLICFLFLSCTAVTVEQNDIIEESDAGIDVKDDIALPLYNNHKNEPDSCGADSYKNGVPVPILCQKGPEKLLEIQEVTDPPPIPGRF